MMMIMMKMIMMLMHCVKSARIRSFSGMHFPTFGLNTEIYGVNLPIQSECGKIWDQKNSKYGHTFMQ